MRSEKNSREVRTTSGAFTSILSAAPSIPMPLARPWIGRFAHHRTASPPRVPNATSVSRTFISGAASRRLSPCQGSSLHRSQPTDRPGQELIYDSNPQQSKSEQSEHKKHFCTGPEVTFRQYNIWTAHSYVRMTNGSFRHVSRFIYATRPRLQSARHAITPGVDG